MQARQPVTASSLLPAGLDMPSGVQAGAQQLDHERDNRVRAAWHRIRTSFGEPYQHQVQAQRNEDSEYSNRLPVRCWADLQG